MMVATRLIMIFSQSQFDQISPRRLSFHQKMRIETFLVSVISGPTFSLLKQSLLKEKLNESDVSKRNKF